MRGWHSASWSRGKEPRSGGMGLEVRRGPPGEPGVDIVGGVVGRVDVEGFDGCGLGFLTGICVLEVVEFELFACRVTLG